MTEDKKDKPTTRVVNLHSEINEKSVGEAIQTLLDLTAEDEDKEITMVICSPGGLVYNAFALIDIMQAIKPNVRTVVGGFAASAAHLIALHGTKGRRFALPNAHMMMHSVTSGTRGSVRDMKIDLAQAELIQEQIINLIVAASRMSKEEVTDLIAKDTWCNARQAMEYGWVDGILKGLYL